MNARLLPLLFVALAALGAPSLAAEEAPPSGQVQIPVEIYNRLVEAARDPSQPPRPTPASYALGNARVSVGVASLEPRPSGEVRVELAVDVLEDEWVLVPVLPAGTPVDSVAVAGKPVQLVATPAGLGWVTNKKGSFKMTLVYRVDAQASSAGFALAVPVPEAAAIKLTTTLPGTGLDVAVIPAAGTRVTPAGSTTRVEATVPTTRGVQVSWRTPADLGHVISRARYSGRLEGGAVTWTGELGVQLFADETAKLALLPRGVTLSTVAVDGKAAPVLVEGDRFATLVRGTGHHTVTVGFQTPVVRSGGPPRVDLRVPQIPISRFELTLPGKKELKATPAASVTHRVRGGATVATVHVPMTGQISFSWSEAVPDEVKTEVRANAAVYHAAHAEEGVLYVHALVQYEVSRGATNVLRFVVPPGVQVNRIEAAGGAVADWRIAPARAGRPRIASVFLNRELEGEQRLDVHYDRSLGTPGEELEVPLLRSQDAQRQRGMVALLASSDLTLDPGDETVLTRVGENQLPAFVRETIDLTVAHTFKYAESPPRLVVRARTPDPVTARFDAQVDTLISLGEVAVTGSATAEIRVKSGTLTALQLELPADVNLLSLSGPSLRSHRAAAADGALVVDVEFTQEMEGHFRLDLTYERILSESEGETRVEVPTAKVRGAEVEQGRLAVEALSAVEVRPATAEQLTVVDVTELPQQLVLRTTNPILMAYKYLHADPPHRLDLTLTRHRIAAVQEATIDRADYRTLHTRDGLQVTTAEFTVRNSRKQFLRLRLPKGSEVWSVFVDGRSEKPALSEGQEDPEGPVVLIKIINSTRGFPVQIVYATEGERLGGLGTAHGTLPRPDILVTHTRWDVYVPVEMSWGAPRTNMDLAGSGQVVPRAALAQTMARAEDGVTAQLLDPLRITVPTAGVHFGFEKVYANQSDQDTWVALPYASRAGALVGKLASAFGALLLWFGLAAAFLKHPRVPPRAALGAGVAGLVIVLASVGVYHVSVMPALSVTIAAALTAAALAGKRRLEQLREVGS